MICMLKRTVPILLAVLAFALSAAESMTLSRTGEPVMERIPFTLRLFDGSWRSYTQGYHGFTIVNVTGNASDGRVEAELKCGKLPGGTLLASIRQTAPHRWSYSAEARFSAPAELKFIGLTAMLPIEAFCGRELLADGKPVLCDHLLYGSAPIPEMLKIGTPSGQNTTIGVVATDAVLTKAQALRMATCAHDGYARTIRPVHTQMDGDTVFALGTGRIDADVNPVQLCAAAAEVTARAIQNALWAVQHP